MKDELWVSPRVRLRSVALAGRAERTIAATSRVRPLAKRTAISRATRTVSSPWRGTDDDRPARRSLYKRATLERTAPSPRIAPPSFCRHCRRPSADKNEIPGVVARFPVMALELGVEMLLRRPAQIQIGDQLPALGNVERARHLLGFEDGDPAHA